MADITVLSWQNENTLRNHPFVQDIELPGVIIDASFVQFDNFVPVLNYISVAADLITIAVQFDTGEQVGTLSKSGFTSSAGRYVRFHEKSAAGDPIRYLGCIVFGDGADDLFNKYVGRLLTLNVSFMQSLVRSIRSEDAVYSFGGLYGDVSLSRTAVDTCIFYNLNSTLNSLTFNAVSNHRYDPSMEINALRQINLVKPLANSIFINSNDVIKVEATGGSALNISLVTANTLTQGLLPTTLTT